MTVSDATQVPAAAAAAAAATTTTTQPLPSGNGNKDTARLSNQVRTVALPLFYALGAAAAATFAFTQLPVLVGGIALGAGAVLGFAFRSHTLVPLLDSGSPALFDLVRTVGSAALAVFVPCTAPYALPAAVGFFGALVGRNIPV